LRTELIEGFRNKMGYRNWLTWTPKWQNCLEKLKLNLTMCYKKIYPQNICINTTLEWRFTTVFCQTKMIEILLIGLSINLFWIRLLIDNQTTLLITRFWIFLIGYAHLIFLYCLYLRSDKDYVINKYKMLI
jgi:hypothetical protein